MHQFLQFILEGNATCFGQFLCPSSRVFHCTHSDGICHTVFLTACMLSEKQLSSCVVRCPPFSEQEDRAFPGESHHRFSNTVMSVYHTTLHHITGRMLCSILSISLPRNSPEYNVIKPTGHVMHHQFNIQQLYALPTQYLCVLYLSQNR